MLRHSIKKQSTYRVFYLTLFCFTLELYVEAK